MKKKIFMSLFGVVALLVATFSCKHSGKNEKIVVKFGESVKVERINLSLVTTGAEVSEGEELIFSPQSLEAGQFVSSWIISGVALPNSKQGRFIYKVKKSDAKKEGDVNVLDISFDTTSSEKIVIKIKDDVLCKDSLSSMNKNSGDEVKEGDKLDFTARLSDEEACEEWYINGVRFPLSSSPLFEYVVKREDARLEDDVATINVSFKKTTVTKLIVRFDDKNIEAIDASSKGVFNEDEVKNTDVITFTAKVEEGKTIDAWFVNNVRRDGQTSRNFVYTPNENDAVLEGSKKIIAIRCEKRTSDGVKIEFNQDDIYTSNCMESGTVVKEGTFILFNSKFTANSYAPTWYINDKKQPPQSLGGDPYYDNFIQTFKYTVDIKDAIDEGGVKVIKVSYKRPDHTKKLKITFPKDVGVIIQGVGEVTSGYEVSCGDDIGIQAKYGYEGENSAQTVALDSWYINDKKVAFPKVFPNPTIYSTGASAFAFVYKVVEEDADKDGVINITYKTHERRDVMIEFNDSSIKAFKGPSSARVPITSGTLIKEDVFLSFQKEVGLDEYFDGNFYFNGKKWEYILSSDLYLLNANDAVERDGILVLQVTTKTRPVNQIKVVWDDSNMKCGMYSTTTPMQSGQTCTEGTPLIFTYNLTDNTKIIKGFFTDGKDESHTLARNLANDKVEGCKITALIKYCKKEGDEYVLHPRFQLETKEMVTITLSNGVTCKNKDTNANITSGEKVLEGTTLDFQASSAAVHTWIVGIKRIEGGRTALKNPSYWCVNKEWAKKEGGDYVANISFE